MDKHFRANRNDLIKRSFRDIADHDYQPSYKTLCFWICLAS